MDVNRLCIACMEESVTGGVCSSCGQTQFSEQTTPNALPPHTILNGEYIVGKAIGHGGFGITYIGWNLKDNNKIAIKEFMPDGVVARATGSTVVSVFTGDKKENFRFGLEKFLDEARMIYKYNNNPYIISVYDLFEENGTAYYVMEYLNGMDLKKYLAKKGGKISFEEVMNIIGPIFIALKTIHKDGLIHRDISPDNIYISSDMQIKLLDFGAARYAMGEKSQNLSVILKLGYAPEEQCRTKGIQGPWTDIYALGATIYNMLTGEKPPEAFDRAAEDTLIKPSKRGVLIPDYAEAALLKAMAVYAKNRYQTVDEFEKALKGEISFPKNIEIKTPEKKSITPKKVHTVEYAGFWKRFAAIAIDMIIMSIVSGICINIDSTGLISIIISWLYFSVMESSSIQGTLGKQALGIIVTDLKGNRISFGLATGRYFSKIISGICLGIGYIMAGTTEKKQALHDLMVGTLVVSKNNVVSVQNIPSEQSFKAVEYKTHANPYIIGISGFFQGVKFSLDKGCVTIGRDYNVCQIIFHDNTPGVSKIHCFVGYDKTMNSFSLMDQGSSFGTFLGSGIKIPHGETIYLKSGEEFYIGENNRFQFKI